MNFAYRLLTKSNETFIEMGIIIEYNSSNRRCITKIWYHGSSSLYLTYHCLRASVSFQTFPADPRTTITVS
uniref:Similar to haloacid dehalogenase-like hydrolase family protein n=1 Tax=Arundo donax TaxID=35708 RepID=A0A0A9DC64_ARUDO